ncbi:MAG: cysteine--tRNA ligase [Promethearchaeota archaeon]
MKIYNTMTNRLERFESIDHHLVRFYACGPTVYDYAHVGHARAAISADVARRHLEYRGYHVLFVQNFTDIDDKIIMRARELGISTGELAERHIKSYLDDMGELNVKKASIHPRATETLDYMLKMIEGLLEKGHAYVLESGEVLFDTASLGDYGKLAKIEPTGSDDASVSGDDVAFSRVNAEGKRNRRDFTLWKPQKPGEPAWDSPWGKGRPGWHIECSAMNLKFLGPQIDIHAGGQDLVFPHHTNEVAQSEAYTGKVPFCRYWMHNGFVQVDHEKMSKSLGNFFTVRELLEQYPGEVIRLFLLSTHYRKPIDFSEKPLKQAQKNYDRLTLALSLLVQRATPSGLGSIPSLPDFSGAIADARVQFEAAMDEDFNTPKALAAMLGFAKRVIKALTGASTGTAAGTGTGETPSGVGGGAGESANESPCGSREALEFYLSTLRVLGLFEFRGERGNLFEKFTKLVQHVVDFRTRARLEKDFSTADEIRDLLREAGVELDDRKDGTTWRLVG